MSLPDIVKPNQGLGLEHGHVVLLVCPLEKTNVIRERHCVQRTKNIRLSLTTVVPLTARARGTLVFSKQATTVQTHSDSAPLLPSKRDDGKKNNKWKIALDPFQLEANLRFGWWWARYEGTSFKNGAVLLLRIEIQREKYAFAKHVVFSQRLHCWFKLFYRVFLMAG